MSTENIFLLLLNAPSNNVELQQIIAKHIHDCYEIRPKNLVKTFEIRKLSNCKFIRRVVDEQCIRHQIKYVINHLWLLPMIIFFNLILARGQTARLF